jgi:predicted dehydrogenase
MEMTRNTFLKTMSAGATFSALPGILKAQQAPSANVARANSKLNIAVIGFGGMGGSNLNSVANKGHTIFALCDVDPNHVKKTREKYPQAKFYVDYREMLAQEKNIDGVVIATPDHTHAVIAAAAMKAGKHAFVQKPLCHDVFECRELMRIAKEKKVVTQMGIQGHASPGHYLIREWVAAGAIGEITSIDSWCDLSYYPWGHAYWSSCLGAKPKEKMPLPEGMNWDIFIGPAEMRDFHRAYHPGSWRAWWDFGNGMMGDRGAHTLDVVFEILNRRMPVAIDATSCGNNPDTHPLSAVITFTFAKPDLKVTWYEGTRPPRPVELPDDQKLPAEGGIILNGTEGKIIAGVYGDSPRIIPEARMKSFKRPEQTLVRPKGGIEGDWLSAIVEGRQSCTDFEYSARLTEFALLGNIAKRADTRLVWDEAAMKVTNIDTANQWIKCSRRAGWEM